MQLKSDDRGFLVGEMITRQDGMLDAQEAATGVLRNIRTDVRSIARALGVRGSGVNARAVEARGREAGVRTAAGGAARNSQAAAQPRDSATGRFVAGARAAVPRRNGRTGEQASAARAEAHEIARTVAKATTTADRDGRGRFTAGKGGKGGKGGGGGGAAGGDDGETQGVGARIVERLGAVQTAMQGMAAGAEQVDPAVAAAHEVKEVVAPLGRGLFALFGRTQEKKKERWYKRFLAAITGKKSEQPAGGTLSTSEGMGIGALAGGVARWLPMMLGGLGTILGGGLAALVGTKIGGAIYDWLDKSGIVTKIFDAFDAAKDWIKDKVGKAKALVDGVATNYATARGIARAGGLDASGRSLDDPRRLDRPTGIAAAVGRVVGSARRGMDYMVGEGGRTAAENRALITGRQWRAGNIAGLSDAQTRALVASTVATESSGGNLGVVNKAGYMGRYQAGAGWLADAGLIRGGPDAVKAAMRADGFSREWDWAKAGGMSRFLKNDGNWAGGMSYGGYLRSADVQDAAFKTNSDKAYAEMVRKGIVGPNTSGSEVAGLLKARHLAGMGGAQAVAAGGLGPADANGTTARKYFDDLARDRGGFLATYSGTATTAGTQRAPGVSIPAPVPDKLPAAEAVATLPANKADADKPVRAVLREPIGQDVGDRNIAHVVSGGIGG